MIRYFLVLWRYGEHITSQMNSLLKCSGKVCEECMIRYWCYSNNTNVLPIIQPWMGAYKIFGRWVDDVRPMNESGAIIPTSAINIAEYIILGKNIAIPKGKWNLGLVVPATFESWNDRRDFILFSEIWQSDRVDKIVRL